MTLYDAPPEPLLGWEGIGAQGASIIVPSALASVLPYHLYLRDAASVYVDCVNCTKFGQLILRIIIKIDATRCQIFRLKYNKIIFCPRPSWGSSQRSPRPSSWIKVGLLLREWEGRGRGKREGKGWEGRAPPIFYCTPSSSFLEICLIEAQFQLQQSPVETLHHFWLP